MGKSDEKYNKICEKLGFIPSELTTSSIAEEDDSQENPFSVLDPEEVMYLLENGHLTKNETV